MPLKLRWDRESRRCIRRKMKKGATGSTEQPPLDATTYSCRVRQSGWTGWLEENTFKTHAKVKQFRHVAVPA